MAQDQLGGAPANVRHQPALIRLRQHFCHALVDQAGFFAPGNHVDGKAEYVVGAHQELVPVARFTQGLRGHRTHLGFLEPGQPFAETRQAVPAALHRLRAQVAFGVQAVALADGLFEVFGAFKLAVVQAHDFESKAVGTQVHSGKTCSILHRYRANVPLSIPSTSDTHHPVRTRCLEDFRHYGIARHRPAPAQSCLP